MTSEQVKSEEESSIGWELHCQNRFKEAIIHFDKAISLYPKNAFAMNNKGLSLRRLKRYKEALDWFDKSIEAEPNFVKPYSNKGETYGMMREKKKAAEWFNKALKVEPDYPRAISGLETYCGQTPSSDVKDGIEAWIVKYPAAVLFVNQSVQYTKIARFTEALEFIEKAISIAPNVPDLLNIKAEVLIRLGRFKDGDECAMKAISLKPDFASAWVNRSWANIQMQNIKDGLTFANNAIKFNPNSAMAYTNAGASLTLLGKFENAVKMLNKALSLIPYNQLSIMWKNACLRNIEPTEYGLIGYENLDLAAAFSEKNNRVSIIFDFGYSEINWTKIVQLTEKYETLVVEDMIDRPVNQINALIQTIRMHGGKRLAIDLMIRASIKSQDNE